LEIDELNLYESLYRFAIHPKLLKLLPAKLQRIIASYDDGYILESDHGSLFLWVHRGNEAGLAFQMQILKICFQHGLSQFLYPMQLTDGRSYAELNDTCWFYITPWPKLQKVRFGYADDLKAIVELLAFFRKVIHESGFLYCLPERKSNFNLLEKYREIILQFNSFEMLAKHRLRPTAFDRQFLLYLAEIRNQILQSLETLEKTDYLNAIVKLTPRDIIINKLTRHNLRIADNGGAICMQLNDFQWNMPIIDLAVLLIKTGRSSKWTMEWFYSIIHQYEQYFIISPLEYQIIWAYITFPWSFYRLASRYYYNRVNWPLRNFVEKWLRLLEDEPNRLGFLENLNS
jgi:hypothetical protein